MSRAAQIILDAAMGYQAALELADPDHVVNDEYFERQAEMQVRRLEEAGLLAGPPPRFPEGDFVDKVTAVLNGYRLRLGPNAVSLIRDGVWQSLPLSLGDIRDIAFLLNEAGLLVRPQAGGSEQGESSIGQHEADTLRPQLQANSKLEQNLEESLPNRPGEADISPREPQVWPPGSLAPDASVAEVIAENDVTFVQTSRGLWHAKPPQGNGRDYGWAWVNEHQTLTEALPVSAPQEGAEHDLHVARRSTRETS